MNPRPRVCILCESNPFTWVDHYVRAFRRRCDVITIGPSLPPETLHDCGLSHLAHLVRPNGIPAPPDAGPEVFNRLPVGWRPQLVVGIARGNMPLLRAAAAVRCPSAFITVDTRQSIYDYLDAPHYDLVFAAQKEFVPRLEAAGSARVHWLPLAFSPNAHFPVEEPETHDIAFIGGARMKAHAERRRLLELLSREFNMLVLSNVYGEELCRAQARGKLAFNRSAADEVNMRVFEALGMGRPLLTDRGAETNGLFELFEDGAHLITYGDDAELVAKARRYLEDNRARMAIAQAGYEEAMARHTYEHRADTLLNAVRAATPVFARDELPLIRKSARLADYLPNIPGHIVDIGLGLGMSKHGLRRMGATECLGITAGPAEASRRAGSYDHVALWSDCAYTGLDTAVVSRPAPEGLEQTLRKAYGMLRPGGALIVRLTPESFSGLTSAAGTFDFGAWLRSYDFTLTLGRIFPAADGEGAILVARKRTRRMVDLVRESLEGRPGQVEDPEALLASIPPDI